ncbi:MAG: hypothetical protein WC337_03650 [Candidatus Muiribacteriota bacterium]
MKSRVFIYVLIILTVLNLTLAAQTQRKLIAGRVNLAYLIMFHPEMRDYMPEYERFTATQYQFEGTEQQRITKRLEQAELTKQEFEKIERESQRKREELSKKNDELTEVTAKLNSELFQANAKFREEMRNLEFTEVAKKEREREAEIQKIELKYQAQITKLNNEIAKINQELDNDDMVKRQQAAAVQMESGELFLDFESSVAKASKIIESIQASVNEVIAKKKYDIVFNSSLYSPLGKIKNLLTYERVFKSEAHGPVGGALESLDFGDENMTDEFNTPLHSLLDSDKEEDIFSFYAQRYNNIENISRVFFVPILDSLVAYGPAVEMREDITKEVLTLIFDKYKVREFERQVTMKVFDMIQEED